MEKESGMTIENVTYLIQRLYVGSQTKKELIQIGIGEGAKAKEFDKNAGRDV